MIKTISQLIMHPSLKTKSCMKIKFESNETVHAKTQDFKIFKINACVKFQMMMKWTCTHQIATYKIPNHPSIHLAFSWLLSAKWLGIIVVKYRFVSTDIFLIRTSNSHKNTWSIFFPSFNRVDDNSWAKIPISSFFNFF